MLPGSPWRVIGSLRRAATGCRGPGAPSSVRRTTRSGHDATGPEPDQCTFRAILATPGLGKARKTRQPKEGDGTGRRALGPIPTLLLRRQTQKSLTPDRRPALGYAPPSLSSRLDRPRLGGAGDPPSVYAALVAG